MPLVAVPLFAPVEPDAGAEDELFFIAPLSAPPAAIKPRRINPINGSFPSEQYELGADIRS
jgi:hypothetical protein